MRNADYHARIKHIMSDRHLAPAHQALADSPFRYRLKELYKPPDDSCELSVVAVHGLGGDFYRIWATSDSQRQISWLSELLPEELPGAHIFSFGYESAPAFGRSITGIIDSAFMLLSRWKSITDKVSEESQTFRAQILTNR
jgi:hypothetical protein